MKTAELLDLARARADIPSDYRLAKILGVTSQTVSQWRSGRQYPDLLKVFQLAELAQLQTVSVAAELELDRAERAARPEQANAWRQVLEKLGGIAAAVIVSVGLGGASIGANPASARVSGEGGPSSPSVDTRYTLCAKRRRKAARARSSIAEAAAVALAALSPHRHASA